MIKAVYGFPVLPKAGLANMLILWAECYLWCKDHGVKQVAPHWSKLRIGPFIRGERDKRQYQLLFNNGGNIAGLKRMFLTLTANKVAFENFDSSKMDECSRTTLVCFSDMNHLERLLSRNKEIIDELYRITRRKYWPTTVPPSFIAIHIRMGDFPAKSETSKQIYFKQPLHWYIDALQELRRSMGFVWPAIVFSDGNDQELKPVLELESVARSPYSKSISDLLAIAKSSVLITSRSSFSLMGAFLGQVPTVWYEGKREICGSGYMNTIENAKLEIEWMHGQKMPEEFIKRLENRTKSN